MKKLLALLVLTILLAGCATASNESFLDEKIKCKKLAEARLEELEKESFNQIEIIGTNYYAPDSSCILAWREYLIEYQDTNNRLFIEDLTTFETIASYDIILAEFEESLDIPAFERSANKFNEKMELYFGKDSRLHFDENIE